MKRIGPGVFVLCACAAAGLLASLAFADEGPPPGTTTTSVTTTTTSQALPEGVAVGGVPVGGLQPADAVAAIRGYFATPLELTVGARGFAVNPARFAYAYVVSAVSRAQAAQPFANVDLAVAVRGAPIRAYVAKLAKKAHTLPVESRLYLRNLKPFLTRDKPGQTLLQTKAVGAIVKALTENSREPVKLPTKAVPPTVTRAKFGPVIVIRRGSNRLHLYKGERPWRVFAVATGQRVYPTPLGRFQIVVKWRNPWWYPPASPWAQGEKPIPPGPSNPLGPRWMGLSAPGVGIHGTNNESSIGYSVSHGCIRMHVTDAEWLFDHVEIGTPVFIVAA